MMYSAGWCNDNILDL